jgi:hypothetical protein
MDAFSVSVSFVPDDVVADETYIRNEFGKPLSYESSSDVVAVAHALSAVTATVASKLTVRIRFSI